MNERFWVFRCVGFFRSWQYKDGCQMLVQIESFAIGSRIRIAHGELDGAAGVINMISDDKLRFYLKIDGLPDGVFITVSYDMLTMDVGVTEDCVTA